MTTMTNNMEIQQTTESYELFTLEPIPDTPFNIVTRKEEQEYERQRRRLKQSEIMNKKKKEFRKQEV